MNPFAFTLHHSFHEYKQTKIEIFFASLKSKIAMYERHVEFTTELYKKEKNDAITQVKKYFEDPLKKANEEYARLIKEYGDNMEGHQLSGHESGLDNMYEEASHREYDISEEFAEMSQNFHNLALMQAHSFFEKEISDLCKILKEEFNQLIGCDDFNSKDYIQGPFKYLDLVIGLEMKRLESFTNKFRDVQYLRNRIAHDRGEFPKNSTNPEDSLKKIKPIVTASKKKLELFEDTDMHNIKITDISYIVDHYQVIREFFQEILNLLEEKLNYKILKSRIQYVFSSLTTKPVVEIDNVQFKSKAFNIRFTIKFPKSSGLGRQLKARLTIAKFRKTGIYINYSGSSNSKITDFVNNLKAIDNVMLNMLYGYLITAKAIQTELFLEESKRA